MTNNFPSYEEFKRVWAYYGKIINIYPENYIGRFVNGMLYNEKRYKALTRIFGHLSGRNVLDIGCGHAVLSLMASYVANHIKGIDISGQYKLSWILIRTMSEKIDFEVKDATEINIQYFIDNNINAILIIGLRPSIGDGGINRLYELTDKAKIEIIVASKYVDTTPSESQKTYDINTQRHSCLLNYSIIDSSHKFMVLQKND